MQWKNLSKIISELPKEIQTNILTQVTYIECDAYMNGKDSITLLDCANRLKENCHNLKAKHGSIDRCKNCELYNDNLLKCVANPHPWDLSRLCPCNWEVAHEVHSIK